MRAHRHTRSNAITLTSALAGLALLTGCGSSTPSSPAATATASPPASAATTSSAAAVPASASARLGAALAALRAAGTVHVDVTFSASGDSVQYSDDSAASGGRQLVTFDKTGHATILFIPGTAYLQADAPTLEGFMGCDQAQAEAAANRWIYLRPGDKFCGTDYDTVTDGITLSSVAGELAMKNGTATTTAPATIAGQRVVGVQGQPSVGQLPASAKEVLYLTDDARLRPVRSEQTAVGIKSEVSFSEWGEKLTLTAPTGAVPASSVTPASSST
jgi:hypothetical protein